VVATFRTSNLAQCRLPILLIQEKPFAKFAIMQPKRNTVSLKGITGSKTTQMRLKNFLHAPWCNTKFYVTKIRLRIL